MAEGDLAAAEIDLKSVLREAPEDPQARLLYGRVNMQRLEVSAAVEQFERSLAAKESREARLLFARALVQADETAELVSDWQAGDFSAVENEPQFQAALAQALLSQAQPEEAALALERALASQEVDDFVEFTRALLALQIDKDPATAKTALQGIVERSPADARAWSLLGLLALRDRDFEAAEGYYEKAAKANPYRVADRIQLVETQVRLGKADAASNNLAGLEGQLPNYPAIRFLRAQLLFDEGKYEGAIDLFNQILSVNPNNAGALLLLANANARINKLPIARRHFEQFLQLQPGNVQATLQLAQVNALLGEPKRTEDLARSLLEVDKDNQTALLLLANALAAQGLNAESAEVFQRIAALQPDSVENLVALGSQQIVSGDIDAGLLQLEGAVDKDPQSALARERLIEARLVAGDLQGAAEEALSYTQVAPESARAVVYLGRVRLQQQERDAARELFNRALELDPASAAARGGLAAVAMLDNDPEGARVQFEKALESNPDSLQMSLNLAVILERLGDIATMEETLLAAIKAHPTATAPRIAVARKALLDGKPAVAIELLAVEEITQQKDFRVLQTLTQAYLNAEQKELALATAKQLLELRPRDPAALAVVAQAHLLAGEYDEAQALTEKALEVAPESILLRKLHIQALVAQSQLARAAEEIDALPSEVKSEPPMLMLRGRAALAAGDIEGAIQSLSTAFDSSPSTQSLSMLATARWLNDERSEVLADLANWLESNPDDAIIRAALAMRQIETGDEAGATENYLKVLESQSDDVVALNNLAWLLREKQSDKALELIKRADRLAPDSASIKDTYAMVELERGEFDRALALNQRALDAAPDSPDIALNRARILAKAGRKTEAKRLLNDLLGDAGDSVSDEARRLLESL
jgi:putative PEP-CTERM system TPR-repeat lipoprotein